MQCYALLVATSQDLPERLKPALPQEGFYLRYSQYCAEHSSNDSNYYYSLMQGA